MLDINDSDYKLLKMSESLLSKLASDSDEFKDALEKYRTLAIRIDEVNFNNFLDKINSYDHNQSLEEELASLEELENEYEQLNELQCKFRNIYQIYVSDELELSNLDTIDIDKIRDRKNLISGYLINVQNIEECKKRLEEYNQELINLNKKNELNHKEYQQLEEKLRESFISAEGRVGDSVLKYTSVKSEYKDNQMDLVSLLNDDDLLENSYKKAEDSRNEQEEVVKTALICYDKIPSKENKEMLDLLRLEEIKTKYKLALLKIVKLIKRNVDGYDELIDKRENLLDLIKKREKYLEKLGKKYVVDPFSRIKLVEQLDHITHSLKDNTREITRIRKLINEFTVKLDDMTNKNSEYLVEFNAMKLPFIKEEQSTVLSSYEENSLYDGDTDVIFKQIADNQVISVNDLTTGFRIDKVHSKTNGVINRVYQMINSSLNDDSYNLKSDNSSLESVDVSVLDDTGLNTNEVIREETNIESLDDEKNEINNDEMFEIGSIVSDDLMIDKELPLSEENSLFSDNIDSPFEDVVYFNDRVNDTKEKDMDEQTFSDIDSSYDGNNDLINEESMPDIFWETKEDEDESSKVESIDEQIKKLKLIA